MTSYPCTSHDIENSQYREGYSWAKILMAQGAAWAKPLRYEYYDGDFSIYAGDRLDYLMRKGMSLPYPVTLVTSRQRSVFSRSWNHIRQDNEDVIVHFYIKKGTFSVTQMGNTGIVNSGQFVFTQTKAPFRWESLSPDNEPTEYYFTLLPPNLVRLHFSDGIPLNTCLSARTDRHLAAPAILTLLHEQGAHLDPEVVNMLISTLLKEAAGAARQQGALLKPRKSLHEKRIEDINSYIKLHLLNSDISLPSVAEACGVSQRYLCYLLRREGTTFSDLLWEGRIKQARELLLALDARHYSISEIAYMSGFKTAPHFSRIFRNYYGCSPREFRLREGTAISPSPRSNHLDLC